MEPMMEYILSHSNEIMQRTGQHISLSFTAVGLACLVGIPTGFLIVNHKRASTIVMTIANIIQTIPSLALFAFSMPLFGIGTRPAIFALFLYALLPIIKNTMIGIHNVNPSTIRAARGMGMTPAQIMFQVEIPLAIPTIMAGVRIAAVTGIGIATIAPLIGAGGLGTIIYQGLGMGNQPMILSGAVFSAILALIVDFLLGRLEYSLTSKGILIGRAAK